MNGKHTGPIINSRHYGNLPKSNKGVFFVAVVVVLFGVGLGLYFVAEMQPSSGDIMADMEEVDSLMDEEFITEETSINEQLKETKRQVEEIIAEEEGTADYFYQRALKKEQKKDYEGAVKDYTRTIELATRYSSEMWNSLNNRGIINAKQFKDYKMALKDFNKIIEIETNRSDGNRNAVRLEAGYTNRAYVKKEKGDKEGACDDLYEALSLGVPESTKFLDKQIEKNCY
jgi:tetratricopeptide (TPR) repeat protein